MQCALEKIKPPDLLTMKGTGRLAASPGVLWLPQSFPEAVLHECNPRNVGKRNKCYPQPSPLSFLEAGIKSTSAGCGFVLPPTAV